MNTNILITSAGKRVVLVRLFQKELKDKFPEAKVYTTDLCPEMAPAGIVSDGCFAVPRVTAADYLDSLIDICREHSVGLVIPTIDTELLVLATNRSKLESHGIIPIISSRDFISACRDKRKTAALFTEKGIRIPEPRDIKRPVYPIFAKPYDGSLSKDIHIIRSAEDVTPSILRNPKLLFMEYIDKGQYKEFTVDLYYGRDNCVKSIIPRERIEIRAGEINKGITRKNALVEFLLDKMGYLPGVVGCICIQLFYREDNQDIVGIEINPRFGGGYPLSYYAGANFPQMLIKEYLEKGSVEYSDEWKDETLMLRYDSEVIVHGSSYCHHL